MILKNLKKPDLNIHKPKISRSRIAMIVGGLLLLLIGIVLLVNYGIPDDDDDLCASVTCPDASGVCKISGTCQPVNGTCLAETNVTDGTSCGDGTAGTVCTAGVCGPEPATGGATADLCASVRCPDASGVCKIAGTCQSASGTCSAETNVTDGAVCEEDGQGNISVCLSGSCDRSRCAADYHVTSGACAPCPGGETNDEGDPISSGDTTCDSSGPPPGMCNSLLPLPDVQDARYNIQETNLELGNNFNVTVSCDAGYGPPATRPGGGQTGTGALSCPSNNTNYMVYGCQGCAADYHVVSDACAPCPGLETNDAGDTISSGDTTCDQPPVPEWIIGLDGETCTNACIRSNKTCSQDDWATADVYNNIPAGMTTGLCQRASPFQYISDANQPAVISGNNPITPYRIDHGFGVNPVDCVERLVSDGASPNCDADPGWDRAVETWLDFDSMSRQRFCKCV
jgi:hypothetical protein